MRRPKSSARTGHELVRATTGQGDDRHLGVRAAQGRWLAFVTDHGLNGASSRCRVTGSWRTVPIEILFNRLLPRLSPTPFPGFNVFVDREAYVDVGGFASGPNEDMTFSRALGKRYPTGVCPAVFFETSGRRIERDGLVRTLWYYTRLECQRQIRSKLGVL